MSEPRSLAAAHVCRWAAALLAMGFVFLAGCGYGQRGIYPPEVSTVATPIFSNRTFYRGLERHLSEALAKEIESRTPYKVVAAAGADSALEGVVTGVQQSRLSRQRETGLPQEMEVRVTVNFAWRNLKTGKVLRERQGFTVVGRYVPSTPAGEALETGLFEAADRTAERIVAVMRNDF